MLNTDVLICGAGPCGLMLAHELGRRGVRALLVESKAGTAFNPQANATQARTMEHFRRLGLADEIRALGLPGDHPTDIAYFTRFDGHELARLRLPTSAQAARAVRSMGGSWSAAELPHRVSQKFVEATLLRHARTLQGIDIRHRVRLDSFSQDAQGVSAQLTPLDGGPAQEVRARYLVAADGARSAVRHALGIGWSGAAGLRREFMGGRMLAVYLRAPAFYQRLRHPQAWMYVAVNAQRRAFMATVDGHGEFAFHAAIHPDEEAVADTWGEAQARLIFAQAMGCELPVEVLSVLTWTAGHALVAERFREGRVFLAGDAVHLFTPTGGLGYNTAVEDAVNLGWKLAHVLQDRAGAGLLDSYEAERRPLAVRNTGYARRFADSVGLYPARAELEADSPEGEAARADAARHLEAHVRLEFNIPGVTFGGRYDGSPAIVPDGSVPPPDDPNVYVPSACPGGRPPHHWLDDGRSLYDSFHREWTLLALGGDAPDGSGFSRAARQLGLDLRCVRHESPALRELYEAPLVLIRPDHIVAWRGACDEQAAGVLARCVGRL